MWRTSCLQPYTMVAPEMCLCAALRTIWAAALQLINNRNPFLGKWGAPLEFYPTPSPRQMNCIKTKPAENQPEFDPGSTQNRPGIPPGYPKDSPPGSPPRTRGYQAILLGLIRHQSVWVFKVFYALRLALTRRQKIWFTFFAFLWFLNALKRA